MRQDENVDHRYHHHHITLFLSFFSPSRSVFSLLVPLPLALSACTPSSHSCYDIRNRIGVVLWNVTLLSPRIMLRMKNVLRPRSVSDTDLCTYTEYHACHIRYPGSNVSFPFFFSFFFCFSPLFSRPFMRRFELTFHGTNDLSIENECIAIVRESSPICLEDIVTEPANDVENITFCLSV